MRTLEPQQPESSRHALAHRPRQAITRNLRILLAAPFLFAATLAAQAPTPPAPAHPAVHRHKKPSPAKLAASQAPAPAPAAPQIPNWPANNKPADASVVWDSHGLLIQASNSSLDQILKEVALKTGATVDGMGADERIFGTYGPGPARDVLTELLDGSGYNILLVGDLGQGTPRRIVLSGRPVASPPGNANSTTSNNDAENDQENEQPEMNPGGQMPPPPQPGDSGVPAVPVRTQQQLLQERQQQIQQMQQQQQQPQGNSQNPQN